MKLFLDILYTCNQKLAKIIFHPIKINFIPIERSQKAKLGYGIEKSPRKKFRQFFHQKSAAFSYFSREIS
jgi:hypothetical protein